MSCIGKIRILDSWKCNNHSSLLPDILQKPRNTNFPNPFYFYGSKFWVSNVQHSQWTEQAAPFPNRRGGLDVPAEGPCSGFRLPWLVNPIPPYYQKNGKVMLVGGFFPTHLKNMLVKLGIFPNFWGENKHCLKPPPGMGFFTPPFHSFHRVAPHRFFTSHPSLSCHGQGW